MESVYSSSGEVDLEYLYNRVILSVHVLRDGVLGSNYQWQIQIINKLSSIVITGFLKAYFVVKKSIFP